MDLKGTEEWDFFNSDFEFCSISLLNVGLPASKCPTPHHTVCLFTLVMKFNQIWLYCYFLPEKNILCLMSYAHFYSLMCSFLLKTVCEGSFHFLLQNEYIGLVRSKTSWKWAQNDPCLWSGFISLWKWSFSETIVFSLFLRWKRPVYKFGHSY